MDFGGEGHHHIAHGVAPIAIAATAIKVASRIVHRRPHFILPANSLKREVDDQIAQLRPETNGPLELRSSQLEELKPWALLKVRPVPVVPLPCASRR